MAENNIVSDENVTSVHHPDYRSDIVKLLKGNLAPATLRKQVLGYHENDIAGALELMSREERSKLYSVLDSSSLAEILEYSENINNYIDELSIRKKVEVINNIEASYASEYLIQTDKEKRKTLLELINPEAKSEIMLLSSFDEDEIGNRMSTNYISIKFGSTVKQAMSSLISQAAENDNISILYVVDEDNTFFGAIELKDLITAREKTDLNNIIMTSYPYVYANEQIDECIERIKDYSEASIPVLDSDNKLNGVLISQDITELVDEIMGDDYAKLAGLSAEEDLYEPVKKSVAKRLPWLVILMGLGLMVSSVVGVFEYVVAHISLIVCFQSLILGMAGNAGTQSLAVTIRILADENMNRKQKLHLVGKEFRVGLSNGLIIGIISFVFIGLYIILIKGQTASYAFSISMCTGIAMLVSIILSSITGTVIPVIFKKLKIDPAVASGPLITTLNDLAGVISYYGLAWLLLINVIKL